MPRTWCKRRCSRPTAISTGSTATASRSGWPGCGRFWTTTRPTSCGATGARPSGPPAAKCRSAIRTTAARRGAPEPAADQPTPSQEFLQLDTELRVTAALAELPPDYQEVIVLRNLQRLPFNEVAERMDRSRPAVQMLWMRAIRKLQEALEERVRDRRSATDECSATAPWTPICPASCGREAGSRGDPAGASGIGFGLGLPRCAGSAGAAGGKASHARRPMPTAPCRGWANCRGISAPTGCSARSAAAAWASSTRPGKKGSIARSP